MTKMKTGPECAMCGAPRLDSVAGGLCVGCLAGRVLGGQGAMTDTATVDPGARDAGRFEGGAEPEREVSEAGQSADEGGEGRLAPSRGRRPRLQQGDGGNLPEG